MWGYNKLNLVSRVFGYAHVYAVKAYVMVNLSAVFVYISYDWVEYIWL